MQDTQILWIDLRHKKDKSCVDSGSVVSHKIQIVPNAVGIAEAVHQYQPQILCFDYDFPGQTDLEILQQSKSRYPSLPVVMLTRDHSAELAIWALRSRAWNYYIKPVAIDKLISSIEMLLKQRSTNGKSQRNNLMPKPLPPTGARAYSTGTKGASTDYAMSYVLQHLDEKITLDHVSKLCGMSRSYFSRSFKSDHRITFQEFLIQERINKAVELLKESDLQVTQIALAVGFSDLSYFTRTFQRHIGILPSCYRKAVIPQRLLKII